MPHRKRYLFVCTNRRPDGHPKGSCAASGSEEIVAKLKEAIARLGAAKDVRACATGCLDLCEGGVAVVVEPDHVAYGKVAVADVEDIARAAAEDRVVSRLVIHGPAPGTAQVGGGGSTGSRPEGA